MAKAKFDPKAFFGKFKDKKETAGKKAAPAKKKAVVKKSKKGC